MHVRPPSPPFSTYIVKVRIQSHTRARRERDEAARGKRREGEKGKEEEAEDRARVERDRKRINIPAICMRGGALVRIDVAARVQGLTQEYSR